MCSSTVLNYINFSEKCKTHTISLTPISEVWLSLHQFSRSLQLPNGIVSTLPVSNFTKISQEISKVHVEIQLPTLSKRRLLLGLFSQNSYVRDNSMVLSQTDRQMDRQKGMVPTCHFFWYITPHKNVC